MLKAVVSPVSGKQAVHQELIAASRPPDGCDHNLERAREFRALRHEGF